MKFFKTIFVFWRQVSDTLTYIFTGCYNTNSVLAPPDVTRNEVIKKEYSQVSDRPPAYFYAFQLRHQESFQQLANLPYSNWHVRIVCFTHVFCLQTVGSLLIYFFVLKVTLYLQKCVQYKNIKPNTHLYLFNISGICNLERTKIRRLENRNDICTSIINFPIANICKKTSLIS